MVLELSDWRRGAYLASPSYLVSRVHCPVNACKSLGGLAKHVPESTNPHGSLVMELHTKNKVAVGGFSSSSKSAELARNFRGLINHPKIKTNMPKGGTL